MPKVESTTIPVDNGTLHYITLPRHYPTLGDPCLDNLYQPAAYTQTSGTVACFAVLVPIAEGRAAVIPSEMVYDTSGATPFLGCVIDIIADETALDDRLAMFSFSITSTDSSVLNAPIEIEVDDSYSGTGKLSSNKLGKVVMDSNVMPT